MHALLGHSDAARATPSVVLLDDHDQFRAGLRAMLDEQGIRVVGDMRPGTGAMEMVRRTRPSVVVVDSAFAKGESTAPLIGRIAELDNAPGTIVFTRSTRSTDTYRSIRGGALGYVAKDAPVEALANAVRAVHHGDAWLDPSVTTTVLRFIRTGRVPMTVQSDMSDREVEVLRLIARGLENTEIADELGISAKTVKNHVSHIFVKLEVANRVQAAVFAVRSGIV